MTANVKTAQDDGNKAEAGTVAMLPDLAAINAYGRAHIPNYREFVSIRPVGEGFSNPTYRVETRDGDAQVLRKMPARRAVGSAHRIDREYRVLSALWPSDVPVPRPIHFCTDPAPAGTAFYLMDFVAGHVFGSGMQPGGASERRRVYLALAECLGRLHAADFRALGLEKFGVRSGAAHFERQVATMTQLYRDTEMEHATEIEELIAMLQKVTLQDHEICLIHGDYRLGNVVVDSDLSGIAAVLDWELSTLGDPLTDVGFCTLMFHWNSPVFGTVIGGGEGIPDEGEFLDTYCRAARRRSLPNLGLYQAFSLFRLACITQAALHRQAAGQDALRSLPPGHEPATMAQLALDLAGKARR